MKLRNKQGPWGASSIKKTLGFITSNWECFNPGMTRLGSPFWRVMSPAAWQRESGTLMKWTPGMESCREGHKTVGGGIARRWRVISQGWIYAWGYGDKMPLTGAYTWRSSTRHWREKSWAEWKGKWVSQLFLLYLKHLQEIQVEMLRRQIMLVGLERQKWAEPEYVHPRCPLAWHVWATTWSFVLESNEGRGKEC